MHIDSRQMNLKYVTVYNLTSGACGPAAAGGACYQWKY